MRLRTRKACSKKVRRVGGPPPVIGHEINVPDGQYLWHLEAAWPDRRTAILARAQSDRDSWLEKEGSDAPQAIPWKPEDLLAAVEVHE